MSDRPTPLHPFSMESECGCLILRVIAYYQLEPSISCTQIMAFLALTRKANTTVMEAESPQHDILNEDTIWECVT